MHARDCEPNYLKLYRSGELERRVHLALAALADCTICPRGCGVDRLADEDAACHTGRYAQVSSYFPHFGEEACLRGWRGSGTIFFSMCNLRCVFCQNYDISQVHGGKETPPRRLAEMMLELQQMGCHNINFVTPEHVVPQMLEGLLLAVEGGLRLPLIYNTSAYDSMHSLKLLDGVVDIYMPDFKMWDPDQSLKFLKAKDYPAVARRTIQEMHRQVGDLEFDQRGLAIKGLLVRHLVMPGRVAGTLEILRFIKSVSENTYINVMGQYYPAGKVTTGRWQDRYQNINRRITRGEYETAVTRASVLGLRLHQAVLD